MNRLSNSQNLAFQMTKFIKMVVDAPCASSNCLVYFNMVQSEKFLKKYIFGLNMVHLLPNLCDYYVDAPSGLQKIQKIKQEFQCLVSDAPNLPILQSRSTEIPVERDCKCLTWKAASRHEHH